ncbi:uncharacterized protein LOC110981688 [Acanthaster planci]|uniref:Uncharacterized protein LOC110981688 n=1 Tax=Acanthaster planci TaxID=133434 RepID=A0A8B7YPH7_ACAPL|nr:uncharacterized protein LOC110981688 [Acanthaster planci]XP_022095180.1 uncharacterized protein LOC110981688 [Acanthaster planci]
MGSAASSARNRPPTPQSARIPTVPPATDQHADAAGQNTSDDSAKYPSQTHEDGRGPEPMANNGSLSSDPSAKQSPSGISQSQSAAASKQEASASPTAISDPPSVTLTAVKSKPSQEENKSKNKNSLKDENIVLKCVEFLKQATNTGGTVAPCSPADPSAFEKNSGRREALRSNFLNSLEQLREVEIYTDDSAMADLLNVCQMSNLTDPETADELVEEGYPDLFLKIWNGVYHDDIYTSKEQYRQYIVYNLLKQASINFTHVSRKLCGAMGSSERGIVPLVAKEFEHPLMKLEALKDGVKKALWDSPRETLKKTINILANIIRGDIDNKLVFRQANIVPHLKALLECRFMIMRAKALLCLVYLINEDENEALNTTDDNIDFVIKVLGKCLNEKGHYSEHYTFSAEVVVDGIVYLAGNDSNKLKLVKKGVIDKLITMLRTERVGEKHAAAKAVWKLAFHEDNKKQFKTNDTLITNLKELLSHESDPGLLKACKTVLWMLDYTFDNSESCGRGSRPLTGKHRARPIATADNEKSEDKPDDAEKGGDGEGLDLDDDDDFGDEVPHVMISYQWGVQKQMIKIKELLKESGYSVWMDVDNMGGSTLESMAAAVERSAVVLICFTEKYKQSASCRTEAEYTYKLQKPIIPLRLQEDYDPDGWLGIMIGAKLYVDMSRANSLGEDFTKLKQQLGGRGRMLKEGLHNTFNSTLQDSHNASGTQKDVSMMQRRPPTQRSTNVKTPGSQEHTDAKTVSTWTNDQVNTWLAKHGLGGLKNRFDGYNGQRLLGLKTISTEAPNFFYSEIKNDLGFKNLLEIVTFKQALDGII